MRELSVSREIAAPAASTWEIATDLDHAAEVVSGIRSIARLDGGAGFGVGTRWRETRRMFGREATEEMEVAALDPGRSYTVEASSRGMQYRSVLSVEPLDAGRSRITMRFGSEAQGWAARASAATLGRLFEGSLRKALRGDLDDIARAAESRTQSG
ncbi:MAG: SRPBCC family protein [Chloroflexi bacterium]|nr:SRPBCC family protein [Chloroflexota bacterium]